MVKKPCVAPASSSAECTRNPCDLRFPLRSLRAAVLALSVFGLALPASAQLPVGPTVAHGSATVGTAGTQMTVTNSPNAILNWQSFSIGANHGVRFQQQGATSQVLNRVTGNDASQILGSLTSNGRVWLINPHGVLFGQNARVDVAGLVASTLNISNADFLASRFNFVSASGPNRGEVMNQGQIRTTFGGRVWLIGEQARNEGLIQTPGGDIVLAAGKSIELIDSGMPNVIVRVSAPENQAVNLGTLVATGGSVDLHASIVNQQGLVRADSVGVNAAGRVVLKGSQAVMLSEASQTRAEGGSVRLEADTFNNRGEVSAKGISVTGNDILQQGRIAAPGGNVTMSAQTTTYLDGTVDVSNPKGIGGSIQLSTGKLEGMAGGSLRADGQQGGSIRVEGRGMVGFSSTFSATGTARGGSIEVTGDQVYLLNADVDASGAQGGMVHLGGGWQGTGQLPHAREVFVSVGSEVRAKGALGGAAAKGAGGEIVVWSTQTSEHYGTLQARDGGRIELSSQGEIRQTGTLQAGPGGSVLFDPKNLIITDSPPDNLTLARKVVSGSVNSAQPALVDGDFFGVAVALDGDRLAVGAHGDNTGDFQAGAVHLFTGVGADFSGLTWRKKLASGTGALGMPTLTANDYFGTSVALRGDLLVVGAPFDDTGGTDRGAVHLFNGVGADFSGLTWQKKLASGIGAIGMPALADADDFGRAVALDGNRLAVGASADDGGGSGRGAVHLFTGVGPDFSGLTWQKKLASGTGAVRMPVLTNVDEFGYSIALEGDRLAVGALLDDTGGTDRGAVHLFTGAETDFSGLTWQKKLASGIGAVGMPALANVDNFGSGVALNGGLLAVGAPFDDTGGTDRGAVHLFTGVGTDFSGLTWQNRLGSGTGATGMPALADGDGFGWSVAMNGNRLAVGARLEDGGGTNRGGVHLFIDQSSSFSGLVWQKRLANGTGTTGMPALLAADSFGDALALDGDRLAVGADNDDTGGLNRGAVHLFTGVGAGFSGLTWQKKLASGAGANGMPALADEDVFGVAVALDGDLLAVGATLDGTGGPSRGAVHLFTGVGTDFSGLSWRKKLVSGSGANSMPALVDGSFFGSAVGLDGDRLAVGALGSVHLFTGVGADFSGLAWRTRLASGTGAAGMPALVDGDDFGGALALDGDRLAVGATGDGTGGAGRGAVHLFTGVGTDFSGLTWRKKLASGTGANGMPTLVDSDAFGVAVALDGDRLAVGALFDDTGGPSRGAVHLLTGVGTDFAGLTWRKKLASGIGANGMPALADDDLFGSSVALDGNRLAVGAVGDDTGGAVYVFTGLSTLGSGAIGVGEATFANNPAGTSFITPASIVALLDAGTAVTLQANNDLTALSSISTNGGGSGGDLILSAGRSIVLNASITTDNGNFTAVAGDAGANPAFRDPGTPTITLADGVILQTGSGTGTLAAVGGDVIALGTGRVASSGAGRWLIYAADPATSPNFSGFNKHYNQTFTLGSTPAYAGTGDWNLYSLAPTLSVTPSNQTISYGDATPIFTASFTGFIDGDTTATAGLSGTATWNIGGPTSTSGNPTAGVHDVSLAGGLASNLGYQFADNAASSNELTVSAKALSLSAFIALDKVYDGTTVATLAGGVLSATVLGDSIAFSGATGVFDNKNVGIDKTVTISGGSLSGADTGNYTLGPTSGSTTADITGRGLTASYIGSNKTYDGTTAATVAGSSANIIPGDIISFSQTAAFRDKNAGVAKPIDVSGIALGGSDAGNYALLNLTATTTANIDANALPRTVEVAQNEAVNTSVSSIDTAVQNILTPAQVPPAVLGVATGRVLDETAPAVLPAFGPLNLDLMSYDETQRLLESRTEFKRKLFADTIYKLVEDPSLADLRPCPSLAEVDSGLCRITDAQRQELVARQAQQNAPKSERETQANLVKSKRKAKVARLPQIERKLVVLFGIDQYADTTIPSLDNAVGDAEWVGGLFADTLGYEVTVVKNPTKADIVRTLNQLSIEVQKGDSVIVYYAGHGFLIEETGVGYWLAADALATDPTTWISNRDISRMLAEIPANQLAMISDSCYSGAFTKEQKVGLSGKSVEAEEILVRRSVVVMSSGGNEPVADGGRNGHSIFAWQLMQAVRSVDNWQAGTTVFEDVQRKVHSRRFPQTPQYGAVVSAGHQAGGDYLFEFRQLEEVR